MLKMLVRCWVIYFLLHLTGKVSLQDSANVFNRVVGDSVTLPCIYENIPENPDVFWRLNESRNVLSIISGEPKLASQDEIFRGRTENFPSEYSEGNYSIQLKDLELKHAGNYTCSLPKSKGTIKKIKIQLFVKEKPEKQTEKPEKPTPSQNSCMKTQSLKIVPFLIAVLGLTLHFI